MSLNEPSELKADCDTASIRRRLVTHPGVACSIEQELFVGIESLAAPTHHVVERQLLLQGLDVVTPERPDRRLLVLVHGDLARPVATRGPTSAQVERSAGGRRASWA